MQEQRQKGFLLLSLRSQFAASEGNKGLGHQRQFYDGQAFFSLVPATNCTALLVKEEKGGDILTKIELPSSDNGHGRELKPTRHPAKIRFWHRINPFFFFVGQRARRKLNGRCNIYFFLLPYISLYFLRSSAAFQQVFQGWRNDWILWSIRGLYKKSEMKYLKICSAK